MDKQSLRDQAKRIRTSFSSSEIRKYSELIASGVIEVLKANTPTNIHVYISRKSEPRTIEIIQWLMENNHTVYAPVLNGKNMYCKKLSDDTIQNIHKNNFDQSDSTACEHTASLGVVIVPTLCFDSMGNRLGYGKGFYDRFLTKHSNSLTIGLCYEANKVTTIPAELHDVQLDVVITEEAIYQSFDDVRSK